MAAVTGLWKVMVGRNMGSRKDRQEDEEGMTPSMSVTSWSAQSFPWGWMRSSWIRMEAWAGTGDIKWGSATGYQARNSEWLTAFPWGSSATVTRPGLHRGFQACWCLFEG